MERELRPPERVLEELYRTGTVWMSARAEERAKGPSAEWGKGEKPPAAQEPRLQEQAADEAHALRERFVGLVREFIERVDEL